MHTCLHLCIGTHEPTHVLYSCTHSYFHRCVELSCLLNIPLFLCSDILFPLRFISVIEGKRCVIFNQMFTKCLSGRHSVLLSGCYQRSIIIWERLRSSGPHPVSIWSHQKRWWEGPDSSDIRRWNQQELVIDWTCECREGVMQD